MPGSRSKPAGSAPAASKALPPLPVPVHCAGEGCRSTTTLVLVSEGAGYEGGLFEESGWTIGTEDDGGESGGSFLCARCFEKARRAGELDGA